MFFQTNKHESKQTSIAQCKTKSGKADIRKINKR